MTPIQGKNALLDLLEDMQVGLFLDELTADISEGDTNSSHAWTDSGLPLQTWNPPPASEGSRSGTLTFTATADVNLAGYYILDAAGSLLFEGWLPSAIKAKSGDTIPVNLAITAG